MRSTTAKGLAISVVGINFTLLLAVYPIYTRPTTLHGWPAALEALIEALLDVVDGT